MAGPPQLEFLQNQLGGAYKPGTARPIELRAQVLQACLDPAGWPRRDLLLSCAQGDPAALCTLWRARTLAQQKERKVGGLLSNRDQYYRW